MVLGEDAAHHTLAPEMLSYETHRSKNPELGSFLPNEAGDKREEALATACYISTAFNVSDTQDVCPRGETDSSGPAGQIRGEGNLVQNLKVCI